jgi:hypothetical protein
MSVAEFPAHLEGGFPLASAEAAVSPLGAERFRPIPKTTVPERMISHVQQAARAALAEDYAPFDEAFGELLPELSAELPYYVESSSGGYYLAPFGRGRRTYAVAILSAPGCRLKEVSVGQTSARYLPVDARKAFSLVRKNFPLLAHLLRRPPVRFELFQADGSSAYYPVWKIWMGSAEFHVDQKGQVSLAGPSYYVTVSRSRWFQWLEKILARHDS